jgi:hypothetical protein
MAPLLLIASLCIVAGESTQQVRAGELQRLGQDGLALVG